MQKELLKALAAMVYNGSKSECEPVEREPLKYLYHDKQGAFIACNGYAIAVVSYNGVKFDPWTMNLARFDPADIKLLCQTRGKTFEPSYFDQYKRDSVTISPAVDYILRHAIKDTYKPIETVFRHDISIAALEHLYKLQKAISPYGTAELTITHGGSQDYWVFHRECYGTRLYYIAIAGTPHKCELTKDENNVS